MLRKIDLELAIFNEVNKVYVEHYLPDTILIDQYLSHDISISNREDMWYATNKQTEYKK